MTRLLHPIVKEICLDDYKYSKVHVTTGALFDINEVLLALGEQTAPEYEPNMVTGPEPESSAEDLLNAVLHRNGWDGPESYTLTLDDLRASYAVIERYDALLRKAGHTL